MLGSKPSRSIRRWWRRPSSEASPPWPQPTSRVRRNAVKARLAQGRGRAGAEVNLSAGYRRLAEAFSGWRDSPQHDRVMKAPNATRMGIASAYAAGSKYQVYWALVVAP